MAALLRSAAGMLYVGSKAETAAGCGGGLQWCDVCRGWVGAVPIDCEAHQTGSRHDRSHCVIEEYGRCEPRGGPLTGDYTVAAVVKARGGGGLEAFLVGSDGAARGATLTRAYACVMVQQALHEELLRSCGSYELTDNVVAFSVAESMPTLKHGQAIRGHYRAGNELVIHARPCLALLPAYMASLSHVRHLRILVDPHRVLHLEDRITSAALASLGNFLPSLLQRRLTFQWDVWDGPPLPSLAALEQATCRFLQTAADSLTSSSTYPQIREIVFEIYPRNVKEPRWLQQARSHFNATLAAAADLRRQALLMSLHRRSAAAGCSLCRLPTALLRVIMIEAIPVVSCTCNAPPSPPHPESQAAAGQLAAQAPTHAHDEVLVQQSAAAAEAQRREDISRAFIMGFVTGAVAILWADWHSGAEERRYAAWRRRPLYYR